MQTLHAAPADTPSLRLLADQTAKVLAGTADALNAMALLTGVDTQVGDGRPQLSWVAKRGAVRARRSAVC